MQYIVTYAGEPVFVSDDKQQSVVYGKMIAAFYFGFDFEVISHDMVTTIKSNTESDFDVIIFGLNPGDMFYVSRLIEASKPESKPKAVTTTRSILPRRGSNGSR